MLELRPSAFVRHILVLAPVVLTGFAMAQDGPQSVLRGTKQFRKTVVTSGMEGPWEITWGPDKMLWTTERTGKRVTRVHPVTGARTVAITLAEVSAPGGQDGLLGLALHPELLKGTGNDFVYVAYTYVDRAKGPDTRVPDPKNPYRFLYLKIVRLTYDKTKGVLGSPMNVITGLPAGNDHVAGRLKFGPDKKLYLTIGDQGNNQLGNFCLPVLAQRLPTQKEVDARDYSAYEGKSLRINPEDGSVPKDNPRLEGVVSHVFTLGHRNPQGLDFGAGGTLYSSEHGPKTDDEVNVLKPGGNYGWPNVAGLKDNNAFQYARWAEATTPCSQLRFNDLAIHPSVPREQETAFTKPMIDPLATLFTVPTGFNFEDPACKGINYICWPTVGASSVEYYESKGVGVPGWDKVLFVPTLKRGSLYVIPLKPDAQSSAGPISRYFQSENRLRDTAVNPDDRKTIYIATDPSGLAGTLSGGVTRTMQDPGAILAFTYTGEGNGGVAEPAPNTTTTSGGANNTRNNAPAPMVPGGGVPARFTAQQAQAGKTIYNSNCAVCHGNSLTNGTFGTPLGGEYFKTQWAGRSLRALYDRSVKTMPPAAPGSLPKESYASIIAYILETNGLKPGASPLPADSARLDKVAIK